MTNNVTEVITNVVNRKHYNYNLGDFLLEKEDIKPVTADRSFKSFICFPRSGWQ